MRRLLTRLLRWRRVEVVVIDWSLARGRWGDGDRLYVRAYAGHGGAAGAVARGALDRLAQLGAPCERARLLRWEMLRSSEGGRDVWALAWEIEQRWRR